VNPMAPLDMRLDYTRQARKFRSDSRPAIVKISAVSYTAKSSRPASGFQNAHLMGTCKIGPSASRSLCTAPCVSLSRFQPHHKRFLLPEYERLLLHKILSLPPRIRELDVERVE
jgi:hypothetical protein